jgi:Uma2 family endonuclease
MATVVKDRRLTFEDFRALVRDGQKADLLEGAIYMASPDNTDANLINGWLYALVLLFVQGKKLGRVYVSRVAFLLDDHNAPEPDIAFVSAERIEDVQRGRVQGGPDLAMEVVSPESAARDYGPKREQYEQAGVREYWIVDEPEQKVTLLRLDAKGKYRQARPRKGVLESKVLPGLWLLPEWLWQDPLPEVEDVLSQIRASEA